jgi:hypothetical protein
LVLVLRSSWSWSLAFLVQMICSLLVQPIGHDDPWMYVCLLLSHNVKRARFFAI